MKNRVLSVLVLMASLFVCTTSRATLIGDTISASGLFLTPGSTTIGPGVDFFVIAANLSLDFGASTLTLTPFSGTSGMTGFGVFVFSGFDDTITGISIALNQGWSGTILPPQFTAHSISLDMGSVSYFPNAQLVFNIQTASGSVPDHGGTVAMFGFAVVALFAARRKLCS